jgi:HD-GYP domain-containing protein (c-di-GMP phosphodiesterase class II)
MHPAVNHAFQRLFAVMEADEPARAVHCRAVATHAGAIAMELGLDLGSQELAYGCGLVHEAPPAALARTRCRDAEIALRHQKERFDGGGEPDGLAGESIPLLARILAVANAYDELTTGSPWREGVPDRAARLRIVRESGTTFDPVVVAAFERLLAAAA